MMMFGVLKSKKFEFLPISMGFYITNYYTGIDTKTNWIRFGLGYYHFGIQYYKDEIT